MTEHQIMIKAIEAAVEKTVNGKIRDLTSKLDTYIKADTNWKEDNQSALDNMRNLTGTGKTLIAVSVGITAIIGAIFAIKKLFSI